MGVRGATGKTSGTEAAVLPPRPAKACVNPVTGRGTQSETGQGGEGGHGRLDQGELAEAFLAEASSGRHRAGEGGASPDDATGRAPTHAPRQTRDAQLHLITTRSSRPQ